MFQVHTTGKAQALVLADTVGPLRESMLLQDGSQATPLARIPHSD